MVSGVLCCVAESPIQWLLALEEPAVAAALDGDSISTLSQHQARYRPQLEFVRVVILTSQSPDLTGKYQVKISSGVASLISLTQ